jgi:hypothetical protein
MFAQWHTYEVEADNPEEAIDIAQEDFIDDMRRPIANTEYDEIIVEDENNKEVAHY